MYQITMKNRDLTCSNVADDSGLFCAQEAMDGRGIHRLLPIAGCHRHAILWHDHQSSNKDKMTENADQDWNSE